ADLVQVIPGSRVAGPALTVRCGQDDNLMVHAAMDRVKAGDVLVLTMPEPRPVALVGELLATQARVQGAAALPSGPATSWCSTLTGWPWSSRRGSTRWWRTRASGPTTRSASAPSCRRASWRMTSTGCAFGWRGRE